PLVLRWLTLGATEPGTPGVLTYGSRLRRFAVFMAVAPPIAFAILAWLSPPRDPGNTIAFLAIETTFPLMALPLCLEFFRVRYRFDETGIHVASPWSRQRTLRWTDVRAIRWRSQLKWLDLSDGTQRVHLSPWLGGLTEFSEACRARVDGALIDGN